MSQVCWAEDDSEDRLSKDDSDDFPRCLEIYKGPGVI